MTAEDCALLARTVEQVIARHGEPEGGDGRLWSALDEAGLTDAVAGPAGDDLGWPEIEVIAAAAGRHRLPAPLVEHLVALWAFRMAGIDVPEGILTVALDPCLSAGDGLKLAGTGAGGRVTGTLPAVPWGRAAGAVASVAATPDGDRVLVLLQPGAAEVRPGLSAAGEPRDSLVFTDAAVTAAAAPGAVDPDRVLRVGACMRAAQIGGAVDAILDLTVEHARTREQFGRPLSAFQAVQHHLVHIASSATMTAAAVAAAFRALDGGRGSLAAVAAAKIKADEAALVAAASAHQVHGAIGVSEEYVLHHYTRRLWTWRTEFGDGAYWRRRLGRLAIEGGSDGLWALLTEGAARPDGVE